MGVRDQRRGLVYRSGSELPLPRLPGRKAPSDDRPTLAAPLRSPEGTPSRGWTQREDAAPPRPPSLAPTPLTPWGPSSAPVMHGVPDPVPSPLPPHHGGPPPGPLCPCGPAPALGPPGTSIVTVLCTQTVSWTPAPNALVLRLSHQVGTPACTRTGGPLALLPPRPSCSLNGSPFPAAVFPSSARELSHSPLLGKRRSHQPGVLGTFLLKSSWVISLPWAGIQLPSLA